jgi:hypothetical protein
MTPEREAYLAKCGNNEKTLRAVLDSQKQGVKTYKHILNNDSLMSKAEIEYVLDSLRNYKRGVSFYRHELNRIKGMDRVVIPSEQYDRRFETYNWYCTKCDSEISVFENYCSECGRRILWGR